MNLLKYIPGFRSQKTWKKFIASGYYITFLAALVTSIPHKPSILLSLTYLAMPFFIFDLLSLVKKKTRTKKQRYKFILSTLATIALFTNFNEARESDISSSPKEETPVADNKPSPTVASAGQVGELHFINTGNSDSILIKHGDQAALIDGGDNDDEKLVLNYLKDQGVKKLDLMVATHNDADHIGGLDTVAKSIPIETVWVSNGDADTKTYRDFINALSSKGLKPSVPLPNAKITIGSATLKVLAAGDTKHKNDNSIVIKYENGNDTALLLGDLENGDANLQAGKINLVKISHHGAKNGTSATLLNQIKPEQAVITVGANNKYGHPHTELLQRMDGITLHRTDECGTIVYQSTGNGLVTDCQEGSTTPGSSSKK